MEVDIQGPAGRLEALYWAPPEGQRARAIAVVCHPHPLFGGTLHNTVVFRTARALHACGLAVLRFNFRGVEKSEGAHDGQGGEELDLLAALEWLGAQHPGAEWWAGGFSFGSRTAQALALREPRIRRVVLIALPVKRFACEGVDRLEQPGFLLFGSQDEYGTLEELRERFPRLPAQLELQQIEGADHYFHGRTPLLEQAVRSYAARSLGLPQESPR